MKKRKKVQILTISSIATIWLVFGLSYLKQLDSNSIDRDIHIVFLDKYLLPLKESSKCSRLLDIRKLIDHNVFEVQDFSNNRVLYSGTTIESGLYYQFESEPLINSLGVHMTETKVYVKRDNQIQSLNYSIHTIITETLNKYSCVVKYKRLI